MHFVFCRNQLKIGVRPYHMSTCRKKSNALVVFADGEYRRYIDERTFSQQITLFHNNCAIILWYLHVLPTSHGAMLFFLFFFLCLLRNDFSIWRFLLCLDHSYPCIVQCVCCSLISMLNMHVDLLMGLWGTFSAKSIH